ncbi:MAG TPA: ABC transporter ATP-binding protein [Candidatus Methylomirabilis sp.]|nr:ABC transporter ATP-binding protein [Candidatus Methylomirabilis sp.]HSC71360.1 ABC transporter ATP-binding protein [Candidatus Methylomirabilis sp.]
MALLQVNGISKAFGGLQAVKDLRFTLEPGEILGIIGPNGAGKTTAFNMIAGYFPPDSGSIHFKGEDITGHRPWDISHRKIARTFQLSKPFGDLSVLENVMVGGFHHQGSRIAAHRKAEEVLDFVGMSHQAEIEAHNLTATDRKRLELARCLATDPELLLLDEVVAGATPAEATAMMELIRKIRDNGVTLLMVEHVMRVVMGLSHRVLVLHHGITIASGAPQVVSRDPAVLKAYLGERHVQPASP